MTTESVQYSITVHKIPITSAGITLKRTILNAGYSITYIIDEKENKITVSKDDTVITSVGFTNIIQNLLDRNYTYKLYLNRQLNNQIKLDKIKEGKLKVTERGKERIQNEYNSDGKILFNLVYLRAVRQAIQQSKELRNLFQ